MGDVLRFPIVLVVGAQRGVVLVDAAIVTAESVEAVLQLGLARTIANLQGSRHIGAGQPLASRRSESRKQQQDGKDFSFHRAILHSVVSDAEREGARNHLAGNGSRCGLALMISRIRSTISTAGMA
ncbi:MAG: hypothetical protein AW07_00023 [Candidatus Accumulibacter sp. SK-11]|nr:MAG: hypothetical protein AW07_00023 [Candidatus Accumulibacter sp. SK-11]